MKVFYVTTLTAADSTERVDVAKFFERKHADNHAARLNGGAPQVEEREESLESQHPAHWPKRPAIEESLSFRDASK